MSVQALVFGTGRELSTLDIEEQNVVRDSIIKAFRDMWSMYTAVAALSLLACCFIRHQELSREHVEAKIGLEKDDAGTEISRATVKV